MDYALATFYPVAVLVAPISPATGFWTRHFSRCPVAGPCTAGAEPISLNIKLTDYACLVREWAASTHPRFLKPS